MGTKLLELDDGVYVEINDPGSGKVEMHTAQATTVGTTMKHVGDMLTKVVRPIGDALAGFRSALNVPIQIESAEVEIGLSFSAEGNLFIAKSKTEGSLKVTVAFKAVAPTPSPNAIPSATRVAPVSVPPDPGPLAEPTETGAST